MFSVKVIKTFSETSIGNKKEGKMKLLLLEQVKNTVRSTNQNEETPGVTGHR